MNWREHVIEVKDRTRLIELIESGDTLISGVAKLHGINNRHECVLNLCQTQQAISPTTCGAGCKIKYLMQFLRSSIL